MSYFDVNSEVVKTGIDYTFKMSQTSMKTDKMCFEFVWESGDGYPRTGIGISSSANIRLNTNGYKYSGISVSESGDSISFAKNEPIMICFDKSDTSKYIFTAIKETKKRTYTFTCSSATKQSEWRIVTWSGNSGKSDNIELRLSQNKMTHMIPTGFSPWFGSISNNRRYSCGRRKSSFTNIPLVYIFIVRS